MFSAKITEGIQAIPASNVQDKYVVDVMSKLCKIAISERLPLKKKVEHVETILDLLELFRTFECKESQKKLAQVQKDLFEQSQASTVALNMAVAMNTVVGFLKKGQQDSGAQKFYAGIDAALDFFKSKKNMLDSEVNNENSFFCNH